MSKHTFDNPSKEFDELCDLINVDSDKWNRSNQEERNKMVLPACQKFVDSHIKINWDDFLNELTENNYHTERAMIEQLLQEKIGFLQKAIEYDKAEKHILDDDVPDYEDNDEYFQDLKEQIEYLEGKRIPPMTEEEKKEFLASAHVEWGGKKGTISEAYGDTKIYTYSILANNEFDQKVEVLFDEFSKGFSESAYDIKQDYYKELEKSKVSSKTGADIIICQNGILSIKPRVKYPPHR